MRENQTHFFDFGPKLTDVVSEVLIGLSKSKKSLPPKLFYDQKGSEIFERICELDDYYPTRSEIEILDTYGEEMAALIGESALIIEPGSGAGEKVRHLLPKLIHPSGYVPMEISRDILLRMTDELHSEFPHLKVTPVCADFTGDIELPLTVDSFSGKKIVFFPGSTIGNFTPTDASIFLQKYSKMIGDQGGMLIGVDLKKDAETFKRAYDDTEGVTAQFNLNLLTRLNRETRATFDLNNFEHQAFYNEKQGRVEMHLRSKIAQLVRVNETVFRFHEGETIHTENSYKYSTDEFIELCAKSGLNIRQFWKDSRGMFCVYYFEKE